MGKTSSFFPSLKRMFDHFGSFFGQKKLEACHPALPEAGTSAERGDRVRKPSPRIRVDSSIGKPGKLWLSFAIQRGICKIC